MKDYLLKKIRQIDRQTIFIFVVVLIYILFEVTNLEYSLNHAFNKLLQYVIVPIFAFGSIIAIKDSTKGIFKKEAISEGILIYLLWWLWVLLLSVFAFAMCLMTYKAYFE